MSQNRFDSLIPSINGDTVIGFTSAKQLKTDGFLDSTKLSTYMMNGEGQSHKKHLGLINLFATTHQKSLPFMRDLFAKSAVLEVEPMQKVTYDLPVNREKEECITLVDTSGEYDYPGIDLTVFSIVLSEKFTKGDILAYDGYNGSQIMVSNDHDVEQEGEGFRHYVYLSTNDKTKWFPKDKLVAGIRYFKVTNVIGEFETDYSNINLVSEPNGTITCEFALGDPRGVEVGYTMKAGQARRDGMNVLAENTKNKIMTQLDAMGGNKEMFRITTLTPDKKGYYKESTIVGSTLEYLALMEMSIMEAQSLIFAKGGTFRTGRGTKLINEGVWHQLQRGKRIKYAKPGGVTLNHFRQAASYLYANSDIPWQQRRMKFKVGSMMEANILQLFREEALSIASATPSILTGADSQMNGKLFTGDLSNLSMNAIQIRNVQIPGIGWIEVELDESLNYQPFADRSSSGFYGNGYAKTSYSALIYDASSPEYSNVSEKVRGASLVEGGTKNSNIYYVKPEGSHLVYGYEQGRMANGSQYENVQSSLKHMGRNFWAHSTSAALVLDTTRYVSIELQ